MRWGCSKRTIPTAVSGDAKVFAYGRLSILPQNKTSKRPQRPENRKKSNGYHSQGGTSKLSQEAKSQSSAFGLLFSDLILLGANTLWGKFLPDLLARTEYGSCHSEANGKTFKRASTENKHDLASTPKGHSVG